MQSTVCSQYCYLLSKNLMSEVYWECEFKFFLFYYFAKRKSDIPNSLVLETAFVPGFKKINNFFNKLFYGFIQNLPECSF